jgi:hypothetical protein
MLLRDKRRLLYLVPLFVPLALKSSYLLGAFGLVPDGGYYWVALFVFLCLVLGLAFWAFRPVARIQNGTVMLKGHAVDKQALQSWAYTKVDESHHNVTLNYEGFSPYCIELNEHDLQPDSGRIYEFLIEHLPGELYAGNGASSGT